MGAVVIGMDPHKRSATIEVMDAQETVWGGGRFGTDTDGFKQMLAYARQIPGTNVGDRGRQGIGAHLAQRLLADGELVVDVSPKLSARARVFATGQEIARVDCGEAGAMPPAAVRTELRQPPAPEFMPRTNPASGQ